MEMCCRHLTVWYLLMLSFVQGRRLVIVQHYYPMVLFTINGFGTDLLIFGSLETTFYLVDINSPAPAAAPPPPP
jgi:hypothetical protein